MAMPPRRRIEMGRRWSWTPGVPALIHDRGWIDVTRAMIKDSDNAAEVNTYMDTAVSLRLGCRQTGSDGS